MRPRVPSFPILVPSTEEFRLSAVGLPSLDKAAGTEHLKTNICDSDSGVKHDKDGLWISLSPTK